MIMRRTLLSSTMKKRGEEFSTKCDTSMKIGRDGQFDLLKRWDVVTGGEIPPYAIFRLGYWGTESDIVIVLLQILILP